MFFYFVKQFPEHVPDVLGVLYVDWGGHTDRGVAEAKPYKKWLEAVNKHMPAEPLGECQLSAQDALKMQAAYGYSGEDVELVIQGMATGGIEPTYCMGDDTALPVLASSSHMLYDYFKQRFAQVGGLCW